MILNGWALIRMNNAEKVLSRLEQGLSDLQAINVTFVIPYFRSLLAAMLVSHKRWFFISLCGFMIDTLLAGAEDLVSLDRTTAFSRALGLYSIPLRQSTISH